MSENARVRLSFLPGWKKVMVGEADEVKRELSEVLSITNPVAWYRRLNGEVLLTVAERRAVETVFIKHNIVEGIWAEP